MPMNSRPVELASEEEGGSAAMGEEYALLRDEILRDVPAAKEAWEASRGKRAAALMLARLRKAVRLSQKDVADRAGWDKSFVSRLEGAQGGVPDTQTMARFAEACGATMGLVVAVPVEPSRLYIVDAIAVSGGGARERAPLSFAALRDREVTLAEEWAEEWAEERATEPAES
jgi:transcriptional regulator with XRE-family HTH domain